MTAVASTCRQRYRGVSELSYPSEGYISRKMLILLVIAVFVLPGLTAARWLAYGPDNSPQVNAIRADRSDPQHIYLASSRGISVSHDGGGHWTQASSGLRGYPVLALEQASSGAWVAGTDHGIFLLPPNGSVWQPSNTVVNEVGTPRVIHVKGITRRVMSHHPNRSVLQARINHIEIAPNRWLAATSNGIFSSSDQGKFWSGGPVSGEREFVTVKAEKELVVAATRSKLLVSTDGGTVWKAAPVASPLSGGVVVLPGEGIFVAAHDGVFRSTNGGVSWEHLTNGIPSVGIGAMTFDAVHNRLLAYSGDSGWLFGSTDKGQNWRRIANPGLGVQHISAINGRLFAVTETGLLVGPDKSQDEATEATRGRGNWFLRLVHRSE